MLVVETFSGDNLRLKLYAKIGWGCPAVFVIIWTIVKAIILPSGPVVKSDVSFLLNCIKNGVIIIDYVNHSHFRQTWNAPG